jgi:uncharacterized glyoxalase superfamily protein PhnB
MASSSKPVPEGFRTVTPCLTLKDSKKAIEFYTKAFGATVMGVHPTPDGKRTMHAQIQIGDSILMMGDEWPDQGCVSAETVRNSPVSLYIYVPNVDAAFKQAVDAGATVVMPLAEAFWGDRCGTVKDPFGYSWTIATHTRDLSPEQIAEGAKTFMATAGKP